MEAQLLRTCIGEGCKYLHVLTYSSMYLHISDVCKAPRTTLQRSDDNGCSLTLLQTMIIFDAHAVKDITFDNDKLPIVVVPVVENNKS